MKYKLSHDKKGLVKYIGNTSYHIHSDELTMKENYIRICLLFKEFCEEFKKTILKK